MKVWVWADVTPDGPAPSALELLTKARELGDEVAAVALGPGAKALRRRPRRARRHEGVRQ